MTAAEDFPEGRARRPGGPLPLPAVPRRVHLGHVAPVWVESGALYFITVCCERRGLNQLCQPEIGRQLIETASFYHARGRWFLRLLLLMPDHLHALIAFPVEERKARVVGDWKQYAARQHGIGWQKNFIDHRIRDDEQWQLKAEYIRQNPVRKGLIADSGLWPYVIEH